MRPSGGVVRISGRPAPPVGGIIRPVGGLIWLAGGLNPASVRLARLPGGEASWRRRLPKALRFLYRWV
jgi:hypothetical protein